MLLHVLSTDKDGSPNIYMFHGLDYYPIVNNRTLEMERQWSAFKKHSLELLRSRQAVATAAEVSTEFTQIPGSPGRTICDLARNWGADLMVKEVCGHNQLVRAMFNLQQSISLMVLI